MIQHDYWWRYFSFSQGLPYRFRFTALAFCGGFRRVFGLTICQGCPQDPDRQEREERHPGLFFVYFGIRQVAQRMQAEGFFPKGSVQVEIQASRYASLFHCFLFSVFFAGSACLIMILTHYCFVS